MALTEQTVIDKIEVTEGDFIQVRRATRIIRDGADIVSTSYARVTYAPGADVSQEDAKVRAIAQAAWTGVAPITPILSTPQQVVSPVEFARLFTPNERIAIRTAAAANSMLADFYALLQLANVVHLTDPDVIAGLTAMTLTNPPLLTVDRKNAILAGQAPA